MYTINNISEDVIEKGKVLFINNISGQIELTKCGGGINTISGDVELLDCNNISVNSVSGDVLLIDSKATTITVQEGWIELQNSHIGMAEGLYLAGNGEIDYFVVPNNNYIWYNPISWFKRNPDLIVPKDIQIHLVKTDGIVYSYTPIEIEGRGKNKILKEKL